MKPHYRCTLSPMVVAIFCCFLAAPAAAGSERWMTATELRQDGMPVSLEIVIDTPQGAGPFPVVLFNHGSTGRGNDTALFKRTWTSSAVSRFFNDRGWAVVYPQRRGRGQSGDLYDEGFELDRSRYSCEPALSLAGLQRAKEDLSAVLKVLPQRPELDLTRMLIGGQSRGGILAMAYAGEHPQRFAGALSFVGGWISDLCPRAVDINHATFAQSGRFGKPTLWIYGENDPFYKLEHSRLGFAEYQRGGGQGTFELVRLAPGNSGHNVIAFPDQWQPLVSRYLEGIR
ncbi:MAG: alpha/beta fold hydrolase [Pseudomonadota bacterium]